jgi:hypothetical protein
MPTPTYTPLATVTLGTATGSVTFSSIPATYRDLILVFNGTSTNTDIASLQVRINADSGTNYSGVFMTGFSGGAVSSSFTDSGAVVGFTQNTGAVNIAQFMDYSATDKHKTILSRQNAATGSLVRAIAMRWANTAAITSLLCRVDTGVNFNSGSTFSLYGVIA